MNTTSKDVELLPNLLPQDCCHLEIANTVFFLVVLLFYSAFLEGRRLRGGQCGGLRGSLSRTREILL